ncbi:HAD-IA family hydrolase [Sphingomonas floccifaciens]|uniref:Phosphoglycolate phosphatase n=1 Tax=Sphingomonas floccifaciens TaxID=1844115 RepID=A0ABW4N8W3_9SPHN
MQQPCFDIVGFDLDGTLIDTSADLTAAVNHALDRLGRPRLDVRQVIPMIGLGGRHMMGQALAATGGGDDALLDTVMPTMLDYYAGHLCVASRPFADCLAALDTLAAQGTRLAVVTNKRESFALPLLEALGMTSRFACIIGGDTLGPGKTKPSPEPILAMIDRCGGGRAAFVGDSIYDVRAAQAAGVPAVAVSFGFLAGPVGDLRADAVIDRYDQLIPTLDRL